MDQAKKPEAKSDSLIARLSQQLAALEKRDWELWLIVTGTGILVGAGLLTLIFPSAILRRGNVRMEIEVSRELFVSLVALLILFNTYIISRRLELRRTRDAVISTTIQSELARLQSFTDPLRSEEHTSELQSRPHLVCRLLLEKKKIKTAHCLVCGVNRLQIRSL